MPTYPYGCTKCGFSADLRVPIADRDRQLCPRCGAPFERALAPPAAVWVKK